MAWNSTLILSRPSQSEARSFVSRLSTGNAESSYFKFADGFYLTAAHTIISPGNSTTGFQFDDPSTPSISDNLVRYSSGISGQVASDNGVHALRDDIVLNATALREGSSGKLWEPSGPLYESALYGDIALLKNSSTSGPAKIGLGTLVDSNDYQHLSLFMSGQSSLGRDDFSVDNIQIINPGVNRFAEYDAGDEPTQGIASGAPLTGKVSLNNPLTANTFDGFVSFGIQSAKIDDDDDDLRAIAAIYTEEELRFIARSVDAVSIENGGSLDLTTIPYLYFFGSLSGSVDVLDGSVLADVIMGGSASELIDGANGNDILFGGEGDDEFFSILGDGSDLIHGGDNSMDGSLLSLDDLRGLGDGDDWVDYSASAGSLTFSLLADDNLDGLITLSNGQPMGVSEQDYLISIENITGTSGADDFNLWATSQRAIALSIDADGAEDDMAIDLLSYQARADAVVAELRHYYDDATYLTIERDTDAGTVEDTFFGIEYVVGTNQNDTLDLTELDVPFSIAFQDTNVIEITLSNTGKVLEFGSFETVLGASEAENFDALESPNSVTIVSGAGADMVSGSLFADVLAGGTQAAFAALGAPGSGTISGLVYEDDFVVDVINGGDGADLIVLGAGDIVDGGAGNDWLDGSGANGGATVKFGLGGGNDFIQTDEFGYLLGVSEISLEGVSRSEIEIMWDPELIESVSIPPEEIGDPVNWTQQVFEGEALIRISATGETINIGVVRQRSWSRELAALNEDGNHNQYSVSYAHETGTSYWIERGADLVFSGSAESLDDDFFGELYGSYSIVAIPNELNIIVDPEFEETGMFELDALSVGDLSAFQTAPEDHRSEFENLGDPVDGSDGDDDLDGTDFAENIFGRSGDDVITGHGGNDRLFGGDGNDILYAGSGNDEVYGGSGDDTIVGGSGQGNDTYNGEGGLDTLTYTSTSEGIIVDLDYGEAFGAEIDLDLVISIENVIGGSGADTLIGNDEANRIEGGNGFDEIEGYGGDDTLIGGAGADTFYGDEGNDTIVGGSGNDTIYAGEGADAIDGGAGSDILRFDDADIGVRVNLNTGTGQQGIAEGDTYTSIERVYGSNYQDTFIGGSQLATFFMGAGNDVVRGLGGGGEYRGEDGDDTFYLGSGVEDIRGGTGYDTVWYRYASTGVTLDWEDTSQNTGDAVGDTFSLIERLMGTDHADTIYGRDASQDRLFGKDGDDILVGRGGNDFLFGGIGADQLDGGSGTDYASYFEAVSGITLNLSDASLNTGEAQGDTFTSIERFIGSRYVDNFSGDGGDNYFIGGLGDDILNGLDGQDRLYGEAGNDTLIGGDGVDRLLGGADDDTMTGGDQNDTFYFDANAGDDTITDWQNGADRLVFLSAAATDSFTELTIVQDGIDVLITHLDGTLRLLNASATDVDISDFTFQ